MGEKLVRCFSEDCDNFRKAGWTYGGECELPRVVISSGTGACLSKVPRPEADREPNAVDDNGNPIKLSISDRPEVEKP